MEWYHYLIIVTFILMVASPAWFFSKVEKFIFNAHAEPHLYVQHISNDNIIARSENMESILRDEKVLHNLNLMIKNTKKRDVKQMWKIKKLEFERQLRWKKDLMRANHV